MPTLQRQIETILASELKNCVTDLETLFNGHVCGHVVSSEFRRKSYEQRHRRIMKVLEAHLSKKQMLKVSTLLSYTPEEWNAVTEESL